MYNTEWGWRDTLLLIMTLIFIGIVVGLRELRGNPEICTPVDNLMEDK